MNKENSEWDVLADGLVVYEAKEICRKLEKVNIRFSWNMLLLTMLVWLIRVRTMRQRRLRTSAMHFSREG